MMHVKWMVKYWVINSLCYFFQFFSYSSLFLFFSPLPYFTIHVSLFLSICSFFSTVILPYVIIHVSLSSLSFSIPSTFLFYISLIHLTLLSPFPPSIPSLFLFFVPLFISIPYSSSIHYSLSSIHTPPPPIRPCLANPPPFPSLSLIRTPHPPLSSHLLVYPLRPRYPRRYPWLGG